MDTSDRYKGWLDDFDREVSQAMQGVGPDAHAAAEKAVEDFSQWWQKEHPASADEPGLAPRGEEINKELELRMSEVRALKTELESLRGAPDARELKAVRQQIETLEAERAALREENGRLEGENRRLLDYRSSIERQVAELRAKMSRAQDDYEAQVRRLEDQATHLAEQMRLLSEGKEFLQKEHARQSSRLEALETELKSIGADKAALERERDALLLKTESLDRTLSEKDCARSELEGRVSELRQQTAAVQQRLLDNRGAVQSDLDTARKEISALAGQNEAARQELAQRQKEGEQMLRQAAQFLEAKVREIQDEWRQGHP